MRAGWGPGWGCRLGLQTPYPGSHPDLPGVQASQGLPNPRFSPYPTPPPDLWPPHPPWLPTPSPGALPLPGPPSQTPAPHTRGRFPHPPRVPRAPLPCRLLLPGAFLGLPIIFSNCFQIRVGGQAASAAPCQVYKQSSVSRCPLAPAWRAG